MDLIDRLTAKGIESSVLDELVHRAASESASRINNQGMSEQLKYLEAVGYSEFDVIAAIS